MNHEIRKIDQESISIIQEIAKETIRKNYKIFFTEDAINYFIDSGQSDNEFIEYFDSCYVLLIDKQIKGFSIFFNNFIHLMMIDNKHQGKGYGSILLEFAESTMRQNNYKKLKLETFKENVQAVNFYRKHGWSITGLKDEKELNVTRVFFEKEIK